VAVGKEYFSAVGYSARLRFVQGLLESLSVACARVKELVEPDIPTDSGISMSVKVNTASDKAIQKLQRKAQRKGRNAVASASADVDFAYMIGWVALQVCGRYAGLGLHRTTQR
jgi:hypothetical protein